MPQGTPTTSESLTETGTVSLDNSPSVFELASVVGVGLVLLLLTIVVICLVTYFVLKKKRNYDFKNRSR